MAINGVTNTSTQSAAATAKKQPSVTDYKDMLGRIGNIPDLEQYEGAIQRMLSGESEMEDPRSGKPLTEDQILMRKLNREYQKTNPLTPSQQQAVLQNNSRRFTEYWKAHGNGGPRPARAILSDGSFKIFNSEDERYEFMKQSNESFLEKVLSVINERKAEREEKAKVKEEKSGG